MSETISDIGSIDPVTNLLTPLFHPHQQACDDHFRFNEPIIEPLTSESRVTVFLLKLNEAKRVAIRNSLMREGCYLTP